MTTWIFQGNPDHFDIDTYLSRVRKIVWLVRQKHFAGEMHSGDRVYLWRASGKGKAIAGVVASGWLADSPTQRLNDLEGAALWRVPQEKRALRVAVDVDRVAGAKEVVQAKWLQDDPVLSTLRILRMRSETNYRLTDQQSAGLERLWRKT